MNWKRYPFFFLIAFALQIALGALRLNGLLPGWLFILCNFPFGLPLVWMESLWTGTQYMLNGEPMSELWGFPLFFVAVFGQAWIFAFIHSEWKRGKKAGASMKSQIHRLMLMTFLLVTFCAHGGQQVAGELQGNWRGNARIIVNWCKQTNLDVTLRISPDGSVSGKVGDATLTNAIVKANRGPIGRKLNIPTDYLVTGQLVGEIVAAEKISREGVNIPFNCRNGMLLGGLHSSGMKFGGEEKMILSASNLKLTNSAAGPTR